MKKILVVLMALFFATGAFAQNAGAKFDYNLWGLAYGAAGSWGSDAKWDYQHIRVRPMFTAGNENIKGVVRLQIDEGYGGNDSPGPLSSAADDAAGPFARNKAVKVQYAYLQASNLFMQGLSFTTGIAPYDYPLIADTELALTGVNYDFGMGNVTLAYAKVNEANRYEKFGSKDNEDVQAYIIDATIKTGVVDIRPALFFINAGKEYMLVSTYNKFKVYMGALNANADMGMFGFDATFAYLKASGKDPAGVLDKLDTSGYGVDLNINIKPDKGMEIGVFGTYTSGTDGTDPKKANFAGTVADLFGGGDTVGKLFLLQRGGTQDFGGVQYLEVWKNDNYGIMAFGISAQYTMDKLTFFGQFGYVMLAKKYASGDKAVGTEIDVKVSYEVVAKTDLFLEYAFVMAGDDGVNSENTQQILWGLKTSI